MKVSDELLSASSYESTEYEVIEGPSPHARKYTYEPSKEEIMLAESLIPPDQLKIHLFVKCKFMINNGSIISGCICISEHLISLGKYSSSSIQLDVIHLIHLFDIKRLASLSKDEMEIETDKLIIYIASPESIRIVRCINRNYMLAKSNSSSSEDYIFEPYNMSHFPKFDPKLSLSQMFQHTYNAYCSFYGQRYHHTAVMYFHRNLIANESVIDLNHLPLRLIDASMGGTMSLLPFFEAMKTSPYVFGITMRDRSRPHLLSEIVPIVAFSRYLHYLSFENCGIDSGIDEFANALLYNPECRLQYLDLSHNFISDCSALMDALHTIESSFIYLNFNNCKLDSKSTFLLSQALLNNKHLWKLNYLYIEGAKMCAQSAKAFAKFFSILSGKGTYVLRGINFGHVLNIDIILNGVLRSEQPIEILHIPNSDLTGRAFDILVEYLSLTHFLKELDISGCKIKFRDIITVIKTLNKNNNIHNFRIILNRLELNDVRLHEVIREMENFPQKWSELSIEDNQITEGDLLFLIDNLEKLTYLSSLKIGGNFTFRDKGIGVHLRKLLRFEHLTELSLSGRDNGGLGFEELKDFLDAMQTNKTIRKLDLTGSFIGDQGIAKVSGLLAGSKTLKSLLIDGARPERPDSLIMLLQSIINNRSLVYCPLPRDDLYESLGLIEDYRIRRQYESVISHKQRKSYLRLMINQAESSITNTSLKNIPELDHLLSFLSLKLRMRLKKANLTKHSFITELSGLKFPFIRKSLAINLPYVMPMTLVGHKQYECNNYCYCVVEHVEEQLLDLMQMKQRLSRIMLSDREIQSSHLSIPSDSSPSSYQELSSYSFLSLNASSGTVGLPRYTMLPRSPSILDNYVFDPPNSSYSRSENPLVPSAGRNLSVKVGADDKLYILNPDEVPFIHMPSVGIAGSTASEQSRKRGLHVQAESFQYHNEESLAMPQLYQVQRENSFYSSESYNLCDTDSAVVYTEDYPYSYDDPCKFSSNAMTLGEGNTAQNTFDESCCSIYTLMPPPFF